MEEISKEQEELLNWYRENKDKLSLKKTRKGRCGGGMPWPLWVVKVVCELLLIGSMPSTIPKILVTLYEELTGELPNEVPPLSFIRQTRLVVQYLGQFLIADKLGWRKTWDQVGTDATTWCHVTILAMVVNLVSEDSGIPETVIVLPGIVMEDETAEKTVDSAFEQVSLFIATLNMDLLVSSTFTAVQGGSKT